jgi:5-methylcytosine-specific restriction endonuclease McrA
MPFKPPTFRPPGWAPSPRKPPEVQAPYYGTAEWKRLAAVVKQRDGYRCTEPDCRTPDRGFGGRLIAGHIIPRPRGSDHPANVRTFCPTCDNRWHAEKGGDRG